MIKEIQNTKRNVYKATGFAFMYLLFGALGAGVIFFVGDIFKIDILGSASGSLYHLFFWATDFYFIGFAVMLSYLIAGLPAIAPALTLCIYFSHFAGLYDGGDMTVPLYSAFFSTPGGTAGGINIGYIGYLILALLLGYLIKYLFVAWNAIKNSLSSPVDKLLGNLGKKIKPLRGMDGYDTLSDLLDLIVLILILPVFSAVVTYYVIRYGIAIPFNALAGALGELLTGLYGESRTLGGLLMGAMVGFDTFGPVSRAAFSVAAQEAQNGNAAMMTSYGLCFASTGWVAFSAWLINIIFKKGGKFDADDGNLAMSGPINAFFDNMKLTVMFSTTYAYRDPLRVIPCYIVSASAVGALASVFGLANPLYLTPEKLELFKSGELYISFIQPLRSVFGTPKGILLPICGAIGVLAGSLLLVFWKEHAYKKQQAKGTYIAIDGDIVKDIRVLCNRRKTSPEAITDEKETADTTE